MLNKILLIIALLFVIIVASIGSNKLEMSIFSAVNFLKDNQLSNGEFATLISNSSNLDNAVFVSSPFVSTFVVHSLKLLDNNYFVTPNLEKVAKFLKSWGKDGVWEFYKLYPIRPDSDDTAVATVALLELGLPTNQTTFERLEKFRNSEDVFYTWLDEGENDVDCVVNANVLFLYSKTSRQTAGTCEYLVKVAKSGNYLSCSKYYLTPFAFTHAYSRTYFDGNASCLESGKDFVINFITNKIKQKQIDSVLESCLALTTLINLDYRDNLKGIADYIISKQNSDGSWNEEVYFIGSGYFGSKELTTALCLEGLAKYHIKFIKEVNNANP